LTGNNESIARVRHFMTHFWPPAVTAHPSTASVPITVLLYNGPLLCGFDVPVKGLKYASDFVYVVCEM